MNLNYILQNHQNLYWEDKIKVNKKQYIDLINKINFKNKLKYNKIELLKNKLKMIFSKNKNKSNINQFKNNLINISIPCVQPLKGKIDLNEIKIITENEELEILKLKNKYILQSNDNKLIKIKIAKIKEILLKEKNSSVKLTLIKNKIDNYSMQEKYYIREKLFSLKNDKESYNIFLSKKKKNNINLKKKKFKFCFDYENIKKNITDSHKVIDSQKIKLEELYEKNIFLNDKMNRFIALLDDINSISDLKKYIDDIDLNKSLDLNKIENLINIKNTLKVGFKNIITINNIEDPVFKNPETKILIKLNKFNENNIHGPEHLSNVIIQKFNKLVDIKNFLSNKIQNLINNKFNLNNKLVELINFKSKYITKKTSLRLFSNRRLSLDPKNFKIKNQVKIQYIKNKVNYNEKNLLFFENFSKKLVDMVLKYIMILDNNMNNLNISNINISQSIYLLLKRNNYNINKVIKYKINNKNSLLNFINDNNRCIITILNNSCLINKCFKIKNFDNNIINNINENYKNIIYSSNKDIFQNINNNFQIYFKLIYFYKSISEWKFKYEKKFIRKKLLDIKKKTFSQFLFKKKSEFNIKYDKKVSPKRIKEYINKIDIMNKRNKTLDTNISNSIFKDKKGFLNYKMYWDSMNNFTNKCIWNSNKKKQEFLKNRSNFNIRYSVDSKSNDSLSRNRSKFTIKRNKFN